MDIVDQPQRTQALNPSRSFIVQAPAGSGKTEILTQRVLRLLTMVQSPEQVVAITFTRKAASEMRARIINALHHAKDAPEPSESHQKTTWQLASDVLKQDTTQQWHLLNNPNRLRILTIDALCARITRAAPLLTHFGAQPDVLQDPTPLYLQAARNLIHSLDDDPPWADALTQIMLHLDNNQSWVEELLMAMLSRRDQWLGHVMNHHQREHLEAGLYNAAQDILERCAEHLPEALLPQILACYQFACEQLGKEELIDWPEANPEHIDQWQDLAQFLLTSSGSLRKSATSKMGFPAQSAADNPIQKALFKEMKAHIKSVLIELGEHSDFIETLQEVLYAPPLQYTEQQWQLIQALLHILPILVAQLTLQFQSRQAVDFIEIAAGAIRALGDADNPTSVALNLDYHIQHLLVDEFQDTSVTQYRLLELLTAGWTPDDGRTLFIVGDPMQSIYRFREAEVGLFLRARHLGLGQIPLEFLQLRMNFRSTRSVIDWVNEKFVHIFPVDENIATGAVPYANSMAANQSTSTGVQVHTLINEGLFGEADRVVDIIRSAKQENPEQSIALLVRSRSHLFDIIPALKRDGLSFLAVEVEKLSHCVVIQDLLSLTRALINLEDKTAWLAVLRAPWCGLTLADLHCLGTIETPTLLTACEQVSLSPEGSERLARVLPILQHAIDQRQRAHLATWVRDTWECLQGPACLKTATEHDNARTFFRLLASLDEDATLPDLPQIERHLEALFAEPDPNADPNLQIMTIHKSKGLEFDTVIIPSLQKRSAIDDSSLLLWHERPRRHDDEADLLLAPIKYVGEDYDPIYRHIRREHSQKSHFESIRLLYVAATRAKSALHLIGTLSDAETTPSSNSFLGLLWRGIEQDAQSQLSTLKSSEQLAQDTVVQQLHRLTLDSMATPSTFTPTPTAQQSLECALDHTAAAVGTVMHQVLQQIANEGLTAWTSERITALLPEWRCHLLTQGVPKDSLPQALETIATAIHSTLDDPKASWLFDPLHTDAHNEYPLALFEAGQVQHLVLDRTFIDRDGNRWIIDYKSSAPKEGQSRDAFLIEQKALYQEQLARYANAMQLIESRPIRCGLYFPLLSYLEEVSGLCALG